MWPDEYENWYTPPASGGIDFGQIISQGLDVLGSVFSGSPYVGAGDPRYQRGNYPITPSYGGGVPASFNYCDGIQLGASAAGGGGGVCVSKLMLIGGALLVGAFVFGSKRGRG